MKQLQNLTSKHDISIFLGQILCFFFSDTPHHAIKEPGLPTERQTEKKLKRYAFISVASSYKITMFRSRIENPADDSEEIPLAM